MNEPEYIKMSEPECVKMKRRGAGIVAKQIAGMSRAEQLEYWKAISQEMLEKKKLLIKKLSKS